MTKNEWLEYFQLVNGRQASPEEVKQALESGDFQAEDVADAPQVAEAASLGTETEPVTDLDQAKEVCPSPQVPFSSESSQAGQVEVGPIQNQGEAPAPSSFGPAESPLAQAEPLSQTENPGQVPAHTNQAQTLGVGQGPAPQEPSPPPINPDTSRGEGAGVENVNPAPAGTGNQTNIGNQAQPVNPAGVTNQATPDQNPSPVPAQQVAQGFGNAQSQGSQYLGQALPPKKTNKKLKWTLISLAAFIGALLLLGGGYSTWRYTSANIEGTWQQTDYKVYNEDKERWSSSKDDDAPKDFHSYLKVYKDKSVQYFAYYTATDYIYNYFDDSSRDYLRSEDYSAVTAESYLGSFDKVDQWNRQFKPSLSKSDYQEKLEEIYKNKLGYNKSDAEDQAKEDANDYAKLMGKKPKYKLTYTVDGDKMTVQRTKVSTGKVVYTAHYKRLSNDKASSVQDDLKDKKSEFKEHMDESDDSDDNY